MKAVTQLVVAVLLVGTASLGAGKLGSGSAVPGIAFQPAAPTARDPVEIRVSGSASGLCAEPALLSRLEAGILRLTLDPGSCPPGTAARTGAPRPFAAKATVDPLPPGTYAVELVADGAVAQSAVLRVGPAPAAAGVSGRSGFGMLAVILLLALAGAILLR